jgi:hypothetical protein
MDANKLSRWLQILGLAGLIASLLFVGLELRQSREIAIADIYQQRAALVIQVQTSMFSPEQHREAYDAQAVDEPLTASEKNLLQFAQNPWFSYWENNHFQYQVGLLSEEQWIASRNSMRHRMQEPIYREWWETERLEWRESFAQTVDEVVAELRAAE